MISKRIYIIIGVIAILLFLAVTAFVVAYKKTHNTDKQGAEEQQPKAVLLSEEKVVSPLSSIKGDAIWFFTNKAKLFRVNVDGTNLTEYPLPAVGGTLLHADWPLAGQDFIATLWYDNKTNKFFYNDEGKKWTPLPPNIQNFSWLPDGRRIVYIWQTSDQLRQQLNLSNADASGYRVISENIFWPDFKVSASPNGREALLVRTKPEGEVNKIYKASLETGKIDTIIGEGVNLDAVWLPEGQKFIFAQAAEYGRSRLFLYDFASKSQTPLNLTTSLNKVVIDKKGLTLYAAQASSDNRGDNFYRLDLASLKQEQLSVASSNLWVKSLHLAEDKLFFVDSREDKLYVIQK